jgi:hypothetical protein
LRDIAMQVMQAHQTMSYADDFIIIEYRPRAGDRPSGLDVWLRNDLDRKVLAVIWNDNDGGRHRLQVRSLGASTASRRCEGWCADMKNPGPFRAGAWDASMTRGPDDRAAAKGPSSCASFPRF